MIKKLSEVIIDDAIYPRSSFDPETVARYREAVDTGATLPPLVVMPDGRLLDGRHRLEAYKQAGLEEVEVVVEEPEDPDARAVELNLRHGRPLTREELRQAARRWYGKKPVAEIAKTLGVTRQTVQKWVTDLSAEKEEERAEIREKALELRAEGKSLRQVAAELGVDPATVSRWEQSSSDVASVKNLTHATPEREEDDEKDREKELPESNTTKELDLIKVIGSETGITGKIEKAPILSEKDRQEEKETEPQTGRQAAEAFRKKHLPYSDMVKEFYHHLKKTSELAEQLVNRREDLIEAIAGMEADGMSITVLANPVVQACDIYFPRLSKARDVLEEVIKREVKGVVVKDRFVVVTGGKKDGG